jgi:hypothetical protein
MDNPSFLSDLADLLGKYEIDKETKTLDILLANYIINQLYAFRELNNRIELHQILEPSLETLNYE